MSLFRTKIQYSDFLLMEIQPQICVQRVPTYQSLLTSPFNDLHEDYVLHRQWTGVCGCGGCGCSQNLAALSSLWLRALLCNLWDPPLPLFNITTYLTVRLRFQRFGPRSSKPQTSNSCTARLYPCSDCRAQDWEATADVARQAIL